MGPKQIGVWQLNIEKIEQILGSLRYLSIVWNIQNKLGSREEKIAKDK